MLSYIIRGKKTPKSRDQLSVQCLGLVRAFASIAAACNSQRSPWLRTCSTAVRTDSSWIGTLVITLAGMVMSSNASALTSDDFDDSELDSAIWKVVDPSGDGLASVDGTRVLLSVPAGTRHDVWTGGNQSLRIMQPTADIDFEIEAKFESTECWKCIGRA